MKTSSAPWDAEADASGNLQFGFDALPPEYRFKQFARDIIVVKFGVEDGAKLINQLVVVHWI